eukprot:6195872-Pleurochrysis_carterae.AAC.2
MQDTFTVVCSVPTISSTYGRIASWLGTPLYEIGLGAAAGRPLVPANFLSCPSPDASEGASAHSVASRRSEGGNPDPPSTALCACPPCAFCPS